MTCSLRAYSEKTNNQKLERGLASDDASKKTEYPRLGKTYPGGARSFRDITGFFDDKHRSTFATLWEFADINQKENQISTLRERNNIT